MFGMHGLSNPSHDPNLKTTGGLEYYQYDGMRNVSDVTDRHGDLVERYRYDAFGGIFTGTTAPYNYHGYTGMRYDGKTSLVDMNARWYDPLAGHFMTEDTYLGELNQPQTLNRYAYVLNNPINNWDPTGHIPDHIANSWNPKEHTPDNIRDVSSTGDIPNWVRNYQDHSIIETLSGTTEEHSYWDTIANGHTVTVEEPYNINFEQQLREYVVTYNQDRIETWIYSYTRYRVQTYGRQNRYIY